MKIIIHENPEVQTLINKIEEYYLEDNKEQFKKYNEELRLYAETNKDKIASFVSRYNDAGIAYLDHNYTASKHMILSLLPECEELGLEPYILKIYNSMAIIESELSSYYESLDYYLKSLEVAKKHPEYKYTAIILNNVGNLFVWLKEYEVALDYLVDAYTMYYQEDVQKRLVIMTIMLNIIECYSYLKQYDNVSKWYELFKDIVEEDNERCVINNLLLCNEIEKHCGKDNIGDLDNNVNQLIENAFKFSEYFYQFRILLRALTCCIELKDKKNADKLIEALNKLNEDTEMDTFLFDFISVKMRYYETFLKGKVNAEITEAYLSEYYHYSEQEIQSLKYTYNHNMIVKTEFNELVVDRQNVLDENIQLEKKVGLDNFTQIYNKLSIQTRVEKIISNQDHHDYKALIVLDIDHFKNVNDVYGHGIGDKVLLNVVSMLKEQIPLNCLLGRFGGDEFILFIDQCKDRSQVEAIAQNLVEQARLITIEESNNQHITFSLGVFMFMHSQDYEFIFKRADEALYKCKNNGRDNFYIIEE